MFLQSFSTAIVDMQIILINKGIAYVKKWNRASIQKYIVRGGRRQRNIVIRKPEEVIVKGEKSGEAVEVSRVNEAERARKK